MVAVPLPLSANVMPEGMVPAPVSFATGLPGAATAPRLAAVIVIGYVPAVPVAAAPDSIAEPLWLSVSVMPAGRAPDSVIAGAGLPDAVTVNVPTVPVVKFAVVGLVIVGGCRTPIVSACWAVP